MDKGKNIFVYVVDDDKEVRDSLAWLLESINLQTKPYESGDVFLEDFVAGQQGCVVLDVRMPGMNGMDLHVFIKKIDPNIPVIIVTGHADVPMAIRAMKDGAFDFIEKPYNDQQMLERIQMAIHQQNDLQKDQQRKQAIQKMFDNLSKRENQVLSGILKSNPNKVIANDLCISIKTVEAHRSSLMSKLDVKTVAELVRLAIEAEKDSHD